MEEATPFDLLRRRNFIFSRGWSRSIVWSWSFLRFFLLERRPLVQHQLQVGTTIRLVHDQRQIGTTIRLVHDHELQVGQASPSQEPAICLFCQRDLAKPSTIRIPSKHVHKFSRDPISLVQRFPHKGQVLYSGEDEFLTSSS